MLIRRSNDRGLTKLDWLSSRHSFSFGDYYDTNHMGFRALRVINDDVISKGCGFGMHGHRDMEIVTIVVDGELEHRDSLGHGEVLRPGEVQVMSAGRGIRHSEYNPSLRSDAHILQIWIEPRELHLTPAYAQREFPVAARRGTLLRVAGPARSSDNALLINQDAHIYVSTLSHNDSVSYSLEEGRAAWIQLVTGSCMIHDTQLSKGDAVALDMKGEIKIKGGSEPSEILLFDLP